MRSVSNLLLSFARQTVQFIEDAKGFEIWYLPGIFSVPFWGRVVSELRAGKPVIVRYSGIFAIIGDSGNFQTLKMINGLKYAPPLKPLGLIINGKKLLSINGFVDLESIPDPNPALPMFLEETIDSGMGFLRLPVLPKCGPKIVYPDYFMIGKTDRAVQVVSVAGTRVFGFKSLAARFQSYVDSSGFPWGFFITSANWHGESAIGSGDSLAGHLSIRDFAHSRGPAVFRENMFGGPLIILDFDPFGRGNRDSYPIYVPGERDLARGGHGWTVKDFERLLYEGR